MSSKSQSDKKGSGKKRFQPKKPKQAQKTQTVAIKEDPDDSSSSGTITVKDESISDTVTAADESISYVAPSIEEEEDEVVEEIEVLINTSASSNLNVLQFPLKPISEKNSTWIPSDGRLRPVQNKLELDYPIADASRYVQVRSDFGGSMPSMLHLQNRTYTSKSIPLRTHMAVGMIRDKTLVLFPLQREVLQMRPSLEHVDKALGTTPMLEADEEMDAPKRIELKAGTTRVPGGVLANQRTSIATQRAQEQSEEFLPLRIHPMGSAEWQALRRKIEASLPPTNFLVRGSVKSYIQSLNYLPSACHDVDPTAEQILNVDENENEMEVDDEKYTDEKEDVKTDPVMLQIQSLSSKVTRFFLSSRGYPIPFPVIYQSLQLDNEQNRTDHPINDIPLLLTCLSGCATMIRGSNFILKSSLLSALSPQLQTVRTFILFLLNRDGILYSQSLLPTLHEVSSNPTDDEEILELLQLLAKKSNTNNCWTMKYDEDICFVENYFPNEATSFRQYWLKKETELEDYVTKYDDLVMTHSNDS